MRLAVIAPMLPGLQELVAQCKVVANDDLEGISVYRMTYAGHSIFAACGGIGVVNGALATNRLITRYKPDAVANIGVAGGLASDLDIGDVVLVRDTIYSDFDNEQLKLNYPFLTEEAFRSDEKLLDLCVRACEKARAICHFIVGRTVSGQAFVSDSDMRGHLVELFGAHCVDRDSAGVAHACHTLLRPYIGIRCISDRSTDEGEQAVRNFTEFLQFASKQASEVLLHMLGELE